MHKRLYSFLETKNCFFPTQFGFRLNLSTNNALMSMTENIQTQLDEKNIALEFLLVSKSFWYSRSQYATKKTRLLRHRWHSQWMVLLLPQEKETVCQYTKWNVLSQRNFNRSSTGISFGSTPLPHLYKWPATKVGVLSWGLNWWTSTLEQTSSADKNAKYAPN